MRDDDTEDDEDVDTNEVELAELFVDTFELDERRGTLSIREFELVRNSESCDDC